MIQALSSRKYYEKHANADSLVDLFVTDRLFVGSLVMVSSQTTRGLVVISVERVSVHLDDGRVGNPSLQRGGLAALAISARYKFGDRVEATCKSEGYELELQKIRFLAPASLGLEQTVMATLYWRERTC
jgi:hypothetical protein